MGSEPEDTQVSDLEGLFRDLRLETHTPAEVAEPLAEPSPTNLSSSVSSLGAESRHSEDQNQEPYRFYAVWHIPNNRGELDLVGIHVGRGVEAYSRILEANNREFAGIRFRRAETLVAAQDLFRSEAEQHGVDPGKAETIYRWA